MRSRYKMRNKEMDDIKNEQFLNKVLLGNCLEWMPQVEDKSVDMILCDLPYGTTACKWDSIIPFEPLWEQYKRIIKDGGAIVLMSAQPFTSALIMSNPKWFKCEWIWYKNLRTGFASAKYHPMKAHENILVFGKGRVTYNPIKIKRTTTKRGTKTTDFGSVYGGFKNDTKPDNQSDYILPHDVLEIKCVHGTEKRFHSTQKPVPLMEYLVKTYSNEGETVLDNCLGSGTTAIACINTNRNFIGIEKELEYCEAANKRIKQALEKK